MRKPLKAIMTLCLLLIAFTASWAITVTVGDGNIITTVLPIQANSNYSYSQQIYIQDDINQPGWIKSISFWHQGGAGGYANSNSWDLYIGHTTKASFDNNNDWVTVDNLTKVFTGTVNMPTWYSLNARWVVATFETPFYYNNIDNLVVAVDENTSGKANVAGNWSGNSSGPNTGLYVNGNNNINPVSPGAGTRTGTLSQIRFEMDVIADPTSVTATAISASQIKLSWIHNAAQNSVMVAYSSTNDFGTPAYGTSYAVGSPIPGGGMVIYNGNGSSFSHTPLDEDTMYYYKLWSVGNNGTQTIAYSTGVTTSARTLAPIPPASTPRFVAEWEQGEGVIIAYTGRFGLPYSMIADLSNRGKVYVLGTSGNQRTASNLLASNGVNMSNVNYIARNGVDTYWTRDYGPLTIFDANGEMGIVDFRYNRNRSYDDAVNSVLDNYFGINYSSMPLVATGGNIMTDGHGKMMSTTMIQTENDGIQNSQVTEYNYTLSQIEDLVEQYLGVTEYIMYADPLANSSIDHIDCHAKLLDVDKVMIARVPSNHANYAALEATVAVWQSKTSSYGTPYRIFRFNQSSANEPYANSFIFNKKIYVPQWNSTASSYDTAAIAAYQNAMPGYEVQGYYNNISNSAWLSDDAFHCRVNTKFDENMLFVHHIPVRSANANGTVSIDADITPTSLVEASGTYVSYRYKNDSNSISTAWVTVPLSLVSGNTWSVDIPAPGVGVSLQYTIRATDSAGRTYDRSLCGRDDPFIVSIEEYHYRSVVTDGNWDALSTWEYSTDLSTWNAASEAPRSGNSSSITVMDTDTVTLGSSVDADQVTIQSGGRLIVPAGITLTVKDGPGTDLVINGNLTLTGVLAFSAGANSSGANSTIEFNGSIPQVAGTGFPQEVKNLIINNPAGVTIPDATVVTGTLTQTSGTISGASNVDGYHSESLNHVDFPETGNIISGWSIAMTTPSLQPERIDRQWVISGSYTGSKTVTFYWNETDDGYFDWSSLEAAVYIDDIKYQTSAVNVLGAQRSITLSFAAFNASTKSDRAGATYTIGRGDGGTLPVELSSFTVALHSFNQVKLQWVTQSETNVSGFRIYRNTENLLETAQMLNHFIPATNTSQMKMYIATDKEIYEEGTYYYWLENVDLNGQSDYHGPIHIKVTFTDAPTPEVPLIQGINSAYPNPFNPIVNITCGMQKGGQTTVQIYNARGQLVKTLFSGSRDKGKFLLQWDGSDQQNLKLPSGVYLIRMDSAGKTSTRKVVLSK